MCDTPSKLRRIRRLRTRAPTQSQRPAVSSSPRLNQRLRWPPMLQHLAELLRHAFDCEAAGVGAGRIGASHPARICIRGRNCESADVALTDLRSEVTAIKCTEPLSVHTRGGAARRRKPVTRSSRKADSTKD